jgi:hypothetical protein
LDLLSPKPASAGSLEAMIVGRIRKTMFNQMVSPFVIAPGRKLAGVRDLAR